MAKSTRRTFIMTAAAISAGLISSQPDARADQLLNADIAGGTAIPDESAIIMGFPGSKTRQLVVTSESLVKGGKPWLPVCGEMQYARYPEIEWREELLKMKAGGLDTIATYVFWIHHEEVEGRWDWTGRRNLRKFLQTVADIGLNAVVRCGPWCHGECRNGGFPDWLQRSGAHLRSTDPAYMAKASELYAQIARQLEGLLWKDNGPVFAIQVENEFSGPAEHLLALKAIAIKSGIDVPIYERTGWPELRTPVPFGELLPLFGDYAEGFWDRDLTKMPGGYGNAFLFQLRRTTGTIGTDQLGKALPDGTAETGVYPYCCCEIGGGMETSYHRRIRIFPGDVLATALVKIGSGNNLQGYYVYHGGTNPEGKLSTLNESQATGYWNDMPVKSYDFQAPLGEFGQVRAHYHLLRRLHLFVAEFGHLLATMPASLPAQRPESNHDTATLRWSVRSRGDSGFIFVNNYQRLQPMPAKSNVQFDVKFAGRDQTVPARPIDVPADSSFILPFNLDVGGITIRSATAQPICTVSDKGTTYVFFASIPGIDATYDVVDKGTGKVPTQFSLPSTASAQAVQGYKTAGSLETVIVTLSDKASLTCWKGELAGRQHLFLTPANLILDGNSLRLQSGDPADLTVSMIPAPAAVHFDDKPISHAVDGIFNTYTVAPKLPKPVVASLKQIAAAGPARAIHNGKEHVAEMPVDSDFDAAAVWRITLPPDTSPDRDLMLRFRYVGDVARLTLDGKLLTDNFYNGTPFDVGLKRYAPDIYTKELLLQILPLSNGAPIYLLDDAWPDFGGSDSHVELTGVDVIENHSVTLTV